MEIISGWQVFSKEEMSNENAIKVFSDMIQNFENDIPKWKEECGMRKLLECQKNACYKAIKALEKQTPKNPDIEGDGYADGQLVYDTWICPCCGEHYEIEYDNYEYCPKCGQHIDRSELE